MCTDVTSGGRHQVAVLKYFTEAAGRLHVAEQCEGGFRSVVLELEQPLQVLPRQTSAGADQVFDLNLAGGVGIAKFERRVKLNYRFIPLQLVLIGETSQQQRGHT